MRGRRDWRSRRPGGASLRHGPGIRPEPGDRLIRRRRRYRRHAGAALAEWLHRRSRVIPKAKRSSVMRGEFTRGKLIRHGSPRQPEAREKKAGWTVKSSRLV